jgi:glycosyltransferase involved in cell wall biosynthesis
MPEVSIVMNCYNGQAHLREAIDSVYSQTVSDWEIVFWDNASTDESAAIACSYDQRLIYHRSPTLTTLGCARRAAVNECTGNWIAFIDTDDVWLPEKLATQLHALRGSDHVLTYAGIAEINKSGLRIRDNIPAYAAGDIFERLLFQFDINMVTPLVRRDVLLSHGINFEESITASEEYNLFMRLAAKGSVLVQPVVLGKYRIYGGSLTERQIARWAVERRFTLNQLEDENPGISLRYPSGFAEARARGEYYEARFRESEGDFKGVRDTMKGIADKRLLYRMLYWASHWPWLWRAVHASKRDGILGTLILLLSGTAKKYD